MDRVQSHDPYSRLTGQGPSRHVPCSHRCSDLARHVGICGQFAALPNCAQTYAIWYTALPSLKSTHASIVQLSVPVLAAAGGVAFLGEALTLRLALASAAILGGIALVILEQQAATDHPGGVRADKP